MVEEDESPYSDSGQRGLARCRPCSHLRCPRLLGHCVIVSRWVRDIFSHTSAVQCKLTAWVHQRVGHRVVQLVRHTNFPENYLGKEQACSRAVLVGPMVHANWHSRCLVGGVRDNITALSRSVKTARRRNEYVVSSAL